METETIMLLIVMSGFIGGLMGSAVFLMILSMTEIWSERQKRRYRRKHNFQMRTDNLMLEQVKDGYRLKRVESSDTILDLSKEKIPDPGDLSDV